MAYNILQQPTVSSYYRDVDPLVSAGNDTFLTVSSSTTSITGITDYKYVADIYINTELVCTQKAFPDPNTKIGVFNLKNIPSSFIENYFQYAGNYNEEGYTILFNKVENGTCTANIQFGEEYLLGGVFTSTKNIIGAHEMVFYNASVDLADSNTVGNYQPLYHDPEIFSFNTRTLTTTDLYPTYYPAYDQKLYFYQDVFSYIPPVRMNIFTYDAQGETLGEYFSYPNPHNTYKGLMYVPVNYSVLRNATGFTADSGFTANYGYDANPDMMNDDVVTYDVVLSAILQSGDTTFNYGNWGSTTYYIQDDCDGRYKRFYVTWLNKLGSYDNWLFTKKSEEKINKTQSEYKKVAGSLQSDGTYYIGTTDRNAQTFYTSLGYTIALSTDFLSEDQVIFFKDLFASPEIYIYDTEKGLTFAASITDNDYTLNKRVNKKLYSLIINFKLAYNDYRQIS